MSACNLCCLLDVHCKHMYMLCFEAAHALRPAGDCQFTPHFLSSPYLAALSIPAEARLRAYIVALCSTFLVRNST